MLRVVSALPAFRGESSARTWLYAVARNEARQWMRTTRRRRQLLTPLEDHPSAVDRPASARTDPRAADRIAALRARLSTEDRSLLILRIDRGFAYTDIARIGKPRASPEVIGREAARLRQRVHEIKKRLRRWSEDPS
jgi:RNA polymerase sigma-70 factor (ECF subfamily)